MRIRTTLALVSVLAGASALAPADPRASAAESLQCKSSAIIYAAQPDGAFEVIPHNEPENGVNDWDQATNGGSGVDGTIVAGPDGVVYQIKRDGKLEKHRWNGSQLGQQRSGRGHRD